mgnify:FL=1
MRIKGIRHTCLAVKDMEEMVKFYQSLGMTKIVRDRIEQGDYLSSSLGISDAMAHVVYLQAEDGSLLELLQIYNKRAPDYSHISYTVDKLEWAAKSPYELVKAKFIQDPEGNWLECVELC